MKAFDPFNQQNNHAAGDIFARLQEIKKELEELKNVPSNEDLVEIKKIGFSKTPLFQTNAVLKRPMIKGFFKNFIKQSLLEGQHEIAHLSLKAVDVSLLSIDFDNYLGFLLLRSLLNAEPHFDLEKIQSTLHTTWGKSYHALSLFEKNLDKLTSSETSFDTFPYASEMVMALSQKQQQFFISLFCQNSQLFQQTKAHSLVTELLKNPELIVTEHDVSKIITSPYVSEDFVFNLIDNMTDVFLDNLLTHQRALDYAVKNKLVFDESLIWHYAEKLISDICGETDNQEALSVSHEKAFNSLIQLGLGVDSHEGHIFSFALNYENYGLMRIVLEHTKIPESYHPLLLDLPKRVSDLSVYQKNSYQKTVQQLEVLMDKKSLLLHTPAQNTEKKSHFLKI